MQNLDFLQVVATASGPFIFCQLCRQLVNVKSTLHYHLRVHHRPAYKWVVDPLLEGRLDLKDVLELRHPKVLPAPWPDNCPRNPELPVIGC